jgi:hypothetical protein
VQRPGEYHYEAALTELINQKRSGKTIAAKPRPRGERRRSDGRAQAQHQSGRTRDASQEQEAPEGTCNMLSPEVTLRREHAAETVHNYGMPVCDRHALQRMRS